VNYPKKNIPQMNKRDDSSFGGCSDNLSTAGIIPSLKNGGGKIAGNVSNGSVNAPQIIGNTTKGSKFVKNKNVLTTTSCNIGSIDAYANRNTKQSSNS